VITNWHVVQSLVQNDGELQLAVKLRDGRTRPAQVLSSSASHDLALLQVSLERGETVRPAEIGRSSELMIGETLIAIGNPQGHANTVTSGVLSAVGRTIKVRTPDGVVRTYPDLLQTDAAINQGNSGGALLDITGKLVGINNAMAVGAENIGFAIPMDTVRQVFERELIQSENIAASAGAAWLGLEVAERSGQVVVTEVVPEGPAARAGVLVGDVLENIGDREVKTSVDYLRRVVSARPREPLAFHVRRGQRELSLSTVPLSRTDAAVMTAIGVEIDEIDARTDRALVRKATLAFYRDSGLRQVNMLQAVLRITHVQPGSPAEAIGLLPGDILLGVFAQSAFGSREIPVTSVRDFAGMLEQQRGRSLRLVVLRGDEDLVGTIDVRGQR
jgi:serine protease Do